MSYFPFVKDRIQFEGKDSDNPLAFRYYDPKRIVGKKTMEEHLRFSVCYWHTFCGSGLDMFGEDTRSWPWNSHRYPMDQAKSKMDAAFEFFRKLGIPFYCFHDRDMAPEGETVAESEKNLAHMVELLQPLQKEIGIKPLWITANLFSHKRYMNGAATNPNFEVVAYAAAQVKAGIDAAKALGSENYLFWGGREGYDSLFNTDMKKERQNMATFFWKAHEYAKKIGYQGQFFIEPKPREPTKHQYDFDVATVWGFLKEFGLENVFKVNIEANHAILAQHSFAHEVQTAIDAGILGSIDANSGDPLLGWDTDYYPNNLQEAVEAMMIILQAGGLGSGGFNFDAELRRNSTDLEDLFYGHIGAMDLFARALLIAHEINTGGKLIELKKDRYESFQSGEGRRFSEGQLSLEDLASIARNAKEPKPMSGKQELCDLIIQRYL